jgi:hypothetical protein
MLFEERLGGEREDSCILSQHCRIAIYQLWTVSCLAARGEHESRQDKSRRNLHVTREISDAATDLRYRPSTARHKMLFEERLGGEERRLMHLCWLGRRLPRNQGWLNFWETRLVTVRKSLHRSCWTELTCQGILLTLGLVHQWLVKFGHVSGELFFGFYKISMKSLGKRR